MKLMRWAAAIAVTTIGLSCGKDSTGSNLNFPNIPAAARTLYCVRGNITTGQSVNGTLTSGDCDTGGSYYESYLFKVATDRNVTISMTSTQFDTYLYLLQIDSIVGNAVFLTPLTEDDDSGTGLNSLISSYPLLAAGDYVIAAAGFDYPDQGTYSLSVQ